MEFKYKGEKVSFYRKITVYSVQTLKSFSLYFFLGYAPLLVVLLGYLGLLGSVADWFFQAVLIPWMVVGWGSILFLGKKFPKFETKRARDPEFIFSKDGLYLETLGNFQWDDFVDIDYVQRSIRQNNNHLRVRGFYTSKIIFTKNNFEKFSMYIIDDLYLENDISDGSRLDNSL